MAYVVKLDDPEVSREIQAMWGASVTGEVDASAAEAEARLVEEIAAILVTSGHNLEGHRILSYLGFLSSEVVLGMGLFRGITSEFADFFGTEAQGLTRKLQEAKAVAFDRLRRETLTAGGNAIIGIDLDYTMFGASIVAVVASGTAVVVE